MYTETILEPGAYYPYIIKTFGLKALLACTDTGYLKILALGFCIHKAKEIIVCKTGGWQLRLWHERGHELNKIMGISDFKHTMKVGYVMHPWGFLRGEKGLEAIQKKYYEIAKIN